MADIRRDGVGDNYNVCLNYQMDIYSAGGNPLTAQQLLDMPWKERMAKNEAKAQKTEEPVSKTKEENKPAPEPVKQMPATPINKETKKELQKMQKQFQQLEEKIAKLNTERTTLEAQLADPATYSDKNKFIETETAYKKAGDELNRCNTEYEKVFERIMELESK